MYACAVHSSQFGVMYYTYILTIKAENEVEIHWNTLYAVYMNLTDMVNPMSES